MSTFCFTSPDERHMLFAEAALRGWVAAAQDYPHLKTREECAAPALQECEALRSEVCCITSQDTYQKLVSSAWINSYVAFAGITDRLSVHFASALKKKPIDEALAIIRPGVSSGEVRDEIDKAYTQYLEAIG